MRPSPGLYGDMALIGRLHPMLVHFPIGLVLIAAAAEVVAMMTDRREWRTVAVANVRAGAVFAIGAATAGWRLASSLGIEATSSLEWHRWLGAIAAVAVFGAALATAGARGRSPSALWSTGSRCSGRRLSSLSRVISGDCSSGARTSCAREQRGVCETRRTDSLFRR